MKKQQKKEVSKVNKIKLRKEKEKQMMIVMKSLSENQLSQEKMNEMKSIKNSSCSNTKNKLTQVKVEKQYQKIVEELDDEPQPVIEIKKDNQPTVNIFQMATFEQKIDKTTDVPVVKKKDYWQQHLDLENETKRLIPELSFETFDGKRGEQKKHQYIEEPTTINDDIYDLDPLFNIKQDLLLKQCNFQPFFINRTVEQQQLRKQLPIYFKESEIIESIKLNLVTIISGETGCGKSTQIPQFLIEAGFSENGIIGVTQPRKLPTISLAKRVAQECNFQVGREVTYQVRHQVSTISKDQKIKFMTDGILVNEMSTLALLPQYSVIIIDEAHERKVNTDILIGILSRVVIIRSKMDNPLRLVIMSATLKLDDFTQNKLLFPRGVNVIPIESRQYPITNYFSKATKENYIEEALNKCIKIHETLPPGDILIFLTGQSEIKNCCQLLEERLRNKINNQYNEFDEEDVNQQQIEEPFEEEQPQKQQIVPPMDIEEENDNYNHDDYMELKQLGVNKKRVQQTNIDKDIQLTEFIVYPLYSKLDYSDQELVFKNNDWQRRRMIVVSTNVAETSITIPTIRYVIDSGKYKKKEVQTKLGLSKHYISWISQAAADQRSGRAGRTGPGYCYRLYSTAVYTNHFQKFNNVEILEAPLQAVLLSLKNIGVKNIFKFPFLSMPDKNKIIEALQDLKELKAIESHKQLNTEDATEITQLGRVLISIPLLPKYSKILLTGRSEDVFIFLYSFYNQILLYTLLLVCVLSVEEILKRDSFQVEQEEQNFQPNKTYIDSDDDVKEFQDKVNRIEEEEQKYKAQLHKQRQESNNIRNFLKSYASKNCQSDLIALINILGEFFSFTTKLIQKNKTSNLGVVDLDRIILNYCNSNHLMFQPIREIYNSLLQIMQILETITIDQKEIQKLNEQLKNYSKPTEQQIQSIIKLIIETSSFNQVCRLSQSYDPERQLFQKYYQSQQTLTKQYIHPSSIVHNQNPNFILYINMLELGEVETKSYLFNVTTIQDQNQLYFLDKRSDLEKKLKFNDETASYSPKDDKIYCTATATVANGWELNQLKLPLPPTYPVFYRIFCKLLLEGEIFQFFKATKKLHKYQISQIKETNLQQYSQTILQTLKNNQIFNKSKLQEIWKSNKKFFLKEFLLFTEDKYHQNITKQWPPND